MEETAEERAERIISAICPHDENATFSAAQMCCEECIEKEIRSAVDEAREPLAAAEGYAITWAHNAGWSTGHGDTLIDILREMRSDQEKQFARIKDKAREEERGRCIKAIEEYEIEQPCDCIYQANGYWYQYCDCGNHGDLAQAESWCTKKNVRTELAKAIRALAGEEGER